MSAPNYFLHPIAFNQVRIGGRLVKAILTKVDGIKIEYDWSEQKPTGKSGAEWIFKGAKPAGPHKLTFLCANGPVFTAAECYDDLRALYERWAPVPTAPAPSTTPTGPGSAYSGPNGAQGNASTDTPGVSSFTGSKPDTTSNTTNPGPRPPTLTIENGFVNYHLTTAISLKGWDGPKPTATRGIEVEIEVIPQKPPVPAGTGVAPPVSPGDKFASTGGQGPPPQGGAAGAQNFDKDAAQAGAAT